MILQEFIYSEMDFTLVLVGPTGHGKSATGNKILGRNAFKSRVGPSDVTRTCELQTGVLENGRTISVIDTPGFCDDQPDLLGEEVKKCITLAGNRIHGILFVVSVKPWFSNEYQKVAVHNLQTIFGENIINYMIAVVTGGDWIKSFPYANNETIIRLCGGRSVLFNNKAEDEVLRSEEVKHLLSQVKRVMSHNRRLPFISQVFLRLQVQVSLRDITTSLEQLEVAMLKADERAEKYFKEATSDLTQRLEAVEKRVLDTATRLEQQLAGAHATHMEVNKIAWQHMTQRINEEVELRVKDATARLEQKLIEAEAARLKADEQMQKLKEVIEGAEKECSGRSETTLELGTASLHVYDDPSSYKHENTVQ